MTPPCYFLTANPAHGNHTHFTAKNPASLPPHSRNLFHVVLLTKGRRLEAFWKVEQLRWWCFVATRIPSRRRRWGGDAPHARCGSRGFRLANGNPGRGRGSARGQYDPPRRCSLTEDGGCIVPRASLDRGPDAHATGFGWSECNGRCKKPETRSAAPCLDKMPPMERRQARASRKRCALHPQGCRTQTLRLAALRHPFVMRRRKKTTPASPAP
jgi:hypothetical protein